MRLPNRAPNEQPREFDPTYTFDRHVADARKDMGEERWAELCREWDEA